MSTHDVPGAKPENHDVLAMGCWASHDDGSLILVESVEAGRVIYSVFDTAQDPVVEYRDAMSEEVFKVRYSWRPGDDDDDDNIRWTWHNKTPFDWDRIMGVFPAGQKHSSAVAQLTAADRVARSLGLRAEAVRERQQRRPVLQRAAHSIMQGILEAKQSLKK